jgi:hypothetical protein
MRCVREFKVRRGAARTADLNMMDDCLKDNVSGECAMEQRKDEVWTLELAELWCCLVSIMIFSGVEMVT